MTLPEPLSPETITDETPAVPDAHSGHHSEERTAINALLGRVGGQMAVETVDTSRAYDPDSDLGRFLLAVDAVTLTLPIPNHGDYFYCFGVGLEGDSDVVLLVQDTNGYDTETAFAAVQRPVLVVGLGEIGTWMVVDLDRGSSGGGGEVLVEQFDTSGTWTMKPGANLFYVEAIGGGGGGGSGRKGAAGTARYGGGGGAGGGSGATWFTRAEILAVYPDAETSGVPVTVGAGGTGGAARATNSVNGLSGGDGGATTFGTLFRVGGGRGGSGGTTTSGHGGGRAVLAGLDDGGTAYTHALGGSASVETLDPLCVGQPGFAGAGGAGASLTTGDTYSANLTNGGDGLGGTGGTSPTDHPGMLGGGGGSGGVSNGAGAHGATPGGGGGGGGAGVNSSTDSGAGGNGGSGRLRITSHFVAEHTP